MSLLDRFDGFILDLDGVVYVGDRAVPGAAGGIAAIRAAGKRLLFLTNDPRAARADYVTRLAGHGIAASPDEVLTCSVATADYIRAHEDVVGRTAFVAGSAALKAEIAATGLALLDLAAGPHADFVVVGGHEGFDYWELRAASQAVIRGARFYTTNRDATFPMPDGPWPATGAVLAGIEVAAGRRATAIGKPEPYIFTVARGLLDGCARIAIVGDNLESDILGGHQAGLATILVLTGNTRQEDLAAAPVAPDFVLPSLGEIKG